MDPAPAPFRVGLVTLSYHSEDDVREMLQSLGDDRQGLDLRIAVVSNSGDCESLRGPGVDVVQSGGNVGFSRGCNNGARHFDNTDVEYLIFVNPDCRMPAYVIRELAQVCAAHPDFGIVAPFTGGENEFVCKPTGKLHEIPGLNLGALFMMRRDVFNRLNGFDEEFFLWWEDTDLRDRVLQAGLRVGMADGICVAHAGGHSYAPADLSQRKFLTRAWISSHALYLIKHRGPLKAATWVAGMCAANTARLLLRRTPPGRGYNHPPESVRFGLRLLTHARQLRSYVSFNGERFGWQG